MLHGNYKILFDKLKNLIPEDRLLHDDLSLLVYGTDASFYRLTPKLIIKTNNEDEVIEVLRHTNALNIPVTFRAAGTSLSGQAISDSVLLITGKGWKNYKINEDASKITLQPSLIGAQVNKYLAPHKKKIGPDPASINSAMIGGIAANNASGMCCGTSQNSYNTLSNMKIIFVDGSLLDTSNPQSVNDFKNSHSDLISEVISIRDEIKSNQELEEKIKRKFKMKNTTGYSMNAFVDFYDPIEIIQHLMIGSEGTLGFIAEITYNTVPEYENKASSLVIYNNIEDACIAVAKLKSSPVDAVELMDRASLRSVENKNGMPSYLRELSDENTALLIETRAVDTNSLSLQIDEIKRNLKDIPTVFPIEFTSKPIDYARLWNIRKGLFPSVGAMRKSGTTCIIEDVTFPILRLAEATIDLQSLFNKYEYSDAIIFGHALEGNLHFVFNQDFNSETEVNRYKLFIDDLTKLVVDKYEGSLKAEHGTGRNMAPFVEYEWGKDAYRLMKKIKNIFDPNNLLNPDVIINNDNEAHLKNLKPLTAANSIIDKCIECGFCEVNCVSADLTITPRHRITAYREIIRLVQNGEDTDRITSLLEKYDYSGNQTCATDGLCALACPVNIDTGSLIKKLRYDQVSDSAKQIASALAGNMDKVTFAARNSLNFVDLAHSLLGRDIMQSISGGLRLLSGNRIPLWNAYLPKGASEILNFNLNKKYADKVVYFPACINRSMGISKDYGNEIPLIQKMESLLTKAGFNIIYPKNINNLCCGMAYASKGYKDAGDKKANELLNELMQISNNGEIPILCDMSPCLYRMKETFEGELKLYEPAEFIMSYLLDKLEFHKVNEKIALHITCSSKKMELDEKIFQLAKMCSDDVVKLEGTCCGFAGDRGFTHPELNEAGLTDIKQQIGNNCEQGYSTSRTCEIGLSLHSGISFKSIVYLVDMCTTKHSAAKCHN